MKKLSIVLIITVIGAVAGCKPAEVETHAVDAKLQVAQEMVEAWNEQDWDRMFGLFAEYGCVHSLMT